VGAEMTPEELLSHSVGDVFKINNQTNTIAEKLGNIEDPAVDEKIVLESFEPVNAAKYPKRLDLTHLPFCTIDPPDAKDFDDAIYWDDANATLYVAIADVSEYVKPFGALDNEAIYRSFSIYLPHRSIPMLPRQLSETLCSLQPHVDRLAYVFEIELERESLEVKRSAVYEALIHSQRRFNYDEVDALFEGKLAAKNRDEQEIFDTLKKLRIITDGLREKRLKLGYDFRSTEIEMELDAEYNLLSTEEAAETPSHALIEDCMLLANKAAAKRLDVGIFRNHEAPSFEKIEALLVDLELIGLHVSFSPDLNKLITSIQAQASALGIREDVDKLIIKSQKKAIYESKSKGHFGLGFDTYTHFTSPIRRYSDLLLHRLLKAQIANDEKQTRYLLSDIEPTCIRLSELERESDKVAWEFMDRKFARWAAQNNGERFRAIITDVSGKNTIARLDDVIQGARLFVMDEDVELLERVEVMIIESDIATARITAKITKRLDP